jgi:hypothetical protein
LIEWIDLNVESELVMTFGVRIENLKKAKILSVANFINGGHKIKVWQFGKVASGRRMWTYVN